MQKETTNNSSVSPGVSESDGSTVDANTVDANTVDANTVNGNFIRRQKQLTQIVVELSDPDRSEVFPLIAGVASLDESEITLYFPAQPPTSVVSDLLEFVAPKDWEAIVVVAEGLAHNQEEGSQDVTIGYGLGRHGEEVSVLRPEGEDMMVSTLPCEGRVLDCCRRVLELPTPPAKKDTVELIISAWLGRVLTRASFGIENPSSGLVKLLESIEVASESDDSGDPGELDWWAIAGLHPLVDEDDGLLTPAELGLQVRALCAQGSWGRIRKAVGKGSIQHQNITASQADWMDDAMFSRWCMAEFPDSEDVMDCLVEILPGDLFDMVVESLEEQRQPEGLDDLDEADEPGGADAPDVPGAPDEEN